MPIPEMADFLYEIGRLSLSVYWMPMTLWSMVAAFFLVLRRGLRKKHPSLNYHMVSALLFSLPLGMLLAALSPVVIPAPLHLPGAVTYVIPYSSAETVLQPSATAGVDLDWNLMHGLGLIVLLISVMGCWKFGGLCREMLLFWRLGRSLQGRPLNDVAPGMHLFRNRRVLDQSVSIVFSEIDLAPMTFGWRRPVIVIPAAMQQDRESLRMILLHELTHVRQGDYARKWLEQCIRTLFFFHPFVLQLSDAIERYREMSCDTEVLNQHDVSARRYASLLLSFAEYGSPAHQTALSMADSSSHLKDRILAMKSYKLFTPGHRGTKKVGLLPACILLAVSTLIVACEVKFEENNQTIVEAPGNTTYEEDAGTAPSTADPGTVFMVVEEMPEIIGGLASLQENITYPALAKKAGIEGRVFVQFVVDEEGRVENPIVVRGIGGGCDEEALRAVQELRLKPGRHRGEVVKVKLSIPITFKLDDDATP